jgi:hypothetical protein
MGENEAVQVVCSELISAQSRVRQPQIVENYEE